MEILEDQHDDAILSLAMDQRLEGVDREAAPPRWVGLQPSLVSHRNVEHRQQRVDRRAQPFVEGQQPSDAALADLAGVVARLDAEITAQEIGDGQVGRRLAVRHRPALEDQAVGGQIRMNHLMIEARLADARLADDGNDLAAALTRAGQRLADARDLRLAADEPRESGGTAGLQPRPCPKSARQFEHRDRLGQALDRDVAQRLEGQPAFGQPGGRQRYARRAGTGELLEARGEMHGGPDCVVLDGEVVANRTDDDLARVDADADHRVDADLAPHLGPDLSHGVVDRERGITGADGVILVGDRRAEHGHDTVAQQLADRAFVAVHAAHHRLYRRIEDMTGRLGIEARHQLERALDVGKQHRDELALALQRAAAGPDDFREMLGRMVGQLDGIFRRERTGWPATQRRDGRQHLATRPHGKAKLLKIVVREVL